MSDAAKTSKNAEVITVSLLNKDFTFKCPGAEVEKLRQAASYLGDKMESINTGSKALGFDQMAVMAAINICAELIEKQGSEIQKRRIAQRLEKIQHRLAAVLSTEEQLELSLL